MFFPLIFYSNLGKSEFEQTKAQGFVLTFTYNWLQNCTCQTFIESKPVVLCITELFLKSVFYVSDQIFNLNRNII